MTRPIRNFVSLFAILLALACSRAPAPETPAQAARAYLKMKTPGRGFITQRPARSWEEGLISGNGAMGALVMGEPLDETISLTRAGLFLPVHEPLPPVGQAFHLNQIRDLLLLGKFDQAAASIAYLGWREGYNGMHWPDPLFPACDLRLSLPQSGEVEDYRRGVDFQTGVAAVGWRDERGPLLRRLFVSRPDNVVVLSIAAAAPASLDCQFALGTHPPDPAAPLPLPEVKTMVQGGWIYCRGAFNAPWPGAPAGYEAVARVIPKGGTAMTGGSRLNITGADEILILIRIEPLPEAAKTRILRIKEELNGLPADFTELLARHAPVHGALFNRARLDLGAGRGRTLPAEALLEKSKGGALNAALLERQFDAGRYAMLSASGEGFPTSQGLWSGAWNQEGGAYNLDGGVQAALAANLPANMPELLDPFFRWLEARLPDFRTNARRLFGARGIYVPSHASSHGLANTFQAVHPATWPDSAAHSRPMTFWSAGAAWAARFFYDYYLYTGDREFLRTRALPFMREVATFYEDFLVEDPGGKLVFSPSCSPVNHPKNQSTPAAVNAAMDVAAARELLANLADACDDLSTETARAKHWRAMLAKLPVDAIDQNGELKEWLDPRLANNDAHPLASHLYPLFAGLPTHIENNPELMDAYKKTLEGRLAWRRTQPEGGPHAAGLVQLGLAAAALRDGALSSEALSLLSNNYWLPNMASTRDPGRGFNIDACGGLPALICAMLVDSRVTTTGVELILLPALPSNFSPGKIEGIRARGQILIERMEWGKKKIKAVLQTAAGGPLRVSTPAGFRSLSIEGAKILAQDTASAIIDMPSNASVTLKIVSGSN